MKVVIAFDVDGTLFSSNGPVTAARLLQLNAMGCLLWLVSPSGLKPQGPDFEGVFREATASDRTTNLRQVRLEELARDALAGTFLYLYVSDNKDYDAARQTGFSYVEASQFV